MLIVIFIYGDQNLMMMNKKYQNIYRETHVQQDRGYR